MANVTIIGSGYVGLVSGVCLAVVGHDVTCVDLRASVVHAINDGHAPFFEPGLAERLREVRDAGRFRASLDLQAAVASSSIVMIAVGTPSTEAGIDLSAVVGASEQIGRAMALAPAYRVVVVKSTVVPGTTEDVVGPAVARASGLSVGEFGLCMNPEFLREGAAVSDFLVPDRVVIGANDTRAADVVASMYEPFACPIVRTTPRNAELIKYTANALLATLISFSNEVAGLCERIPGADVDMVMDGVHLDRRLTPVVDGRRIRPDVQSYLRAGSGFGGSCFPKDVKALQQFAAVSTAPTPMLDAVLSINTRRPAEVAALADRLTGGLQGKVVALLGLTFKPDTDDLRESPALALAAALSARGAVLRAFDPLYADETHPWTGPDIPRTATAADAVAGADLAVLATGWPQFRTLDWAAAAATMRTAVVLDARNAFRDVVWPDTVRYVRVGLGL